MTEHAHDGVIPRMVQASAIAATAIKVPPLRHARPSACATHRECREMQGEREIELGLRQPMERKYPSGRQAE